MPKSRHYDIAQIGRGIVALAEVFDQISKFFLKHGMPWYRHVINWFAVMVMKVKFFSASGVDPLGRMFPSRNQYFNPFIILFSQLKSPIKITEINVALGWLNFIPVGA